MAICCATTLTGFCLEDGTSIGIIVQNGVQTGWIDFSTGITTLGPPPAGTVPCAGSSSSALEKGTSAVVASVAAAATSTLLLAANPSRHSFHIFNDSAASVFVKFGLAAGVTSFTVKIISNVGKDFVYPSYIGDVTAIWQSADGFARVTEVIV